MDQPRGTGRLTTHVLDTMTGLPAAAVLVELFRVEERRLAALASQRTNADGRCEAPLLAGEAMRAGRYELRFHAGAYFRARGVTLPDPAFLEIVPIAFGIADPARHLHVPLLISPYAYSTYRGS